MSEPSKDEIADLHYALMYMAARGTVFYGCRPRSIVNVVKKWVKQSKELESVKAERDRYKSALEEIGKYDKNSKYGDGICPYGCDCPDIARQALETP